MVSQNSVLYRFSPDGQPEKPKELLRELLLNKQSLPIEQLVVGPKINSDGGDQFFLLSPDQRDHYVRAISRYPGAESIFKEFSLISIDEGIGSKEGQLLTPIALAFDRQRTRLLVLEAQGSLKVFDARPDVEHRYITQWGQVGRADGAFLVSVPVGVSMVVDVQGMIYVADGSGRIQVFTP